MNCGFLINYYLILSLVFIIVYPLGPPKLTIEPPDEVWFEPNAIKEEFIEVKLTLKCEATGNPEM